MYATLSDLNDRFTAIEIIQLTDTSGSGVVDMVPVDRAIADADAEIEAALRGRYALPISTTPLPDMLVRIASDLVRESLYSDRPTETVVSRAKTARALLAKIASGALRLDISGAGTESSMAGLVEIVTGRKKSPFEGF